MSKNVLRLLAAALLISPPLSALATVLQEQKRLAPAESLFREVLALRRQLLGDRHPQVVTSLNNLAFVLHEQGRFAAAESVCADEALPAAAVLDLMAGLVDKSLVALRDSSISSSTGS